MLQNHGRQEQTIRLKAENEKALTSAKLKFNEMRKAYDAQVAKKRGKRLPDDVLANRKEMIELLEQDIKDLEQAHSQIRPRRGGDGNRDLARQLKENRQREREEDAKLGKEAVPMGELSAGAQQFQMEKEDHDAKTDQQLDLIRTGVRDLHDIASEMHEELQVQQVVIEEVNKEFDVLEKKFKTANQRLNTLLEEVR